ncbi:MAG: ABC transporter ATP-binding protein [Lachnospiraceae bacterium]|nr:ABC transporter ATP-binding protein [Lachnospiraceae bacterium]
MKAENAIEVKNITKKFRIYHDKGNMLKEKALHWSRNKYEEQWVLNGISFEVKKGEAVGLIGHNGCGKSTTLKMLTKIIYPDSGSIELSGRISSLLELGAGFHPDLSGRENIYINASIFGLSRKEIDKRIEDIISFSELEEFIDNPVRTYSSGMYMRLAFSVAINVDADILLIDEILAVGDLNFQTKCFNKLMEIKGNGTTIVLVSHSTSQIESICDKSIWIHDGVVREQGDPVRVHRSYINYMCAQRSHALEEKQEKDQKEAEEKKISEAETEAPVKVGKVRLTDAGGNSKRVFYVGEAVSVLLDLEAATLIKNYNIEVNLVRADGLFCFGASTALDSVACEEWKGEKKIGISFSQMNLLKGKYHFDLHIANADGSTILFQGNVAEFEVELMKPDRGVVYLNHEWTKG